MYKTEIKNSQGNIVLSTIGDFRVLAYTATTAKRVLGALEDGTEVSVKAAEVNEAGETVAPLASFTGDAEIATMVLSSRVSKLRSALKAAGKETDESGEANEGAETTDLSDGGPANVEATEPTPKRRR